MLPRRASGRVTRPTPRRPSSCRRSPVRCSAASSPSISTGPGYSGSTCRCARWPTYFRTTCSGGCPVTSVRISSTCSALLMVGAAIPLMLALTWGGRRYAWSAPETIALVALSAALWALFAWRVMTAREPFIPIAVLRDGAVRVGTVAGFCVVGMVIALTIVLPLYGQVALELSVSASAWTIVALQGGATVASIFGGRMLVRFVHYKRVPLAGLLVSIAGLIPLALAPNGLSAVAALAL